MTPEAAPPALDFWSMLFVFVLSSFIGLGVIRRVSRLLHTPLMSITNANRCARPDSRSPPPVQSPREGRE